jgi:lysophospholipase L1-like esterase
MSRISLTRPPRWAVAVMTVFAVVDALVLVMLFRQTPADADAAPAVTPPTAATSASPTPAAAVPSDLATPTPTASDVLTVYGDGYAAGNEQGGIDAAGWPALVSSNLGMTLSLHAVSQAGYVSLGVTGKDLDGLVREAPPTGAAVTVLFGSRNDRGESAEQVQVQVTQTIADVRAAAPQTRLVVIGPAWSDAAVPADLVAARDAVKAAAVAAGVTFVDPIAEQWFSTGTGLIAGDGVSPTDLGHAFMAGEILPVVKGALTSSAVTTTN